MSTINKITQILETAPAQLQSARETAEGAVEVPLQADSANNRMFELRQLNRALEPLAAAGWEIEPGPRNFRSGEFSAIVVRPPLETVNTASLSLRDRVRVEAGIRKPKKYRTHGYTPDVVDELEIDDRAGTVAVDTAEMHLSRQKEAEHIVNALRNKGWQGTVARTHGGDGITATLTAPARGEEVTEARIEHTLRG